MLGNFAPDALAAFQNLVAEGLPEEEVFDFARCVRPDGSVYGTGGTCRKGREQAARDEAPAKRKRAPNQLSNNLGANFLKNAPKEKLEEYLARSINDRKKAKIEKELARREKERAPSVPTDLKKQLAALNPQAKSPGLPTLQKENDKLVGDLASAAMKGDRTALSRVQKELEENDRKLKEKAEAGKADSKYGPWGDDQLKDQLSAARKLGRDDIAKRIENELKRREVNTGKTKVPEAKGAEVAQKKYADLMKKQQDLINAGKVSDAMSMQRNVDAARLAWEKENAPALKAANNKMQEDRKNTPKGLSVYSKEQLEKLDRDVEAKTTSRVGKTGYDWGESLRGDAKTLGQGMYGTAIVSKSGDVVKRGELGPNEAKLIDKVGKLDLGPKLISAELDGPGNYDSTNSRGRVAMSRVEGKPVENQSGPQVEKGYWTARANLHRAGIAHNDMHPGNILIDSRGKGRFVDLGMAQDSPKAALAEAFGAFSVPLPGTVVSNKINPSNKGDWQVQRWGKTGGEALVRAEKRGGTARANFDEDFPTAARVLQNKENAIKRMRKFGLNDQEITDVMFHGIRSKDSDLEKGAMGKLSNDQAKKIIEDLYDGI